MQRVFLCLVLMLFAVLLMGISFNFKPLNSSFKETITVTLIVQNVAHTFELEAYSTIQTLIDAYNPTVVFDEAKINRMDVLGHRDVVVLEAKQNRPCISINGSDAEQLATLKGVGLKAARAIVEFRTRYGRFKRLEDLMLVNGVGRAKFEAMKDSLCL